MNINNGLGTQPTSYGFGDWQTRFPDDGNTGTENPKSDSERIQRIAYLEQKVEQLRDMVRNCDAVVDRAKDKVTRLRERVRSLNERAYQAEGKYNRLNNEQGRLEGKQAGIRAKRRRIESQLNQDPQNSYLRSELERLEDERWRVVDELDRVSNAKSNTHDKWRSLESSAREADYDLSEAVNAVDARERDWVARKEQLAQHERELASLR